MITVEKLKAAIEVSGVEHNCVDNSCFICQCIFALSEEPFWEFVAAANRFGQERGAIHLFIIGLRIGYTMREAEVMEDLFK